MMAERSEFGKRKEIDSRDWEFERYESKMSWIKEEREKDVCLFWKLVSGLR